MRHIKYYIPGVTLILMAGLIIAVPEILVAMISGFIIMTGFLVCYIGHGLRKSEIALRRMDRRFRTPDWHRYGFYK
jgi:hypothetical protein